MWWHQTIIVSSIILILARSVLTRSWIFHIDHAITSSSMKSKVPWNCATTTSRTSMPLIRRTSHLRTSFPWMTKSGSTLMNIHFTRLLVINSTWLDADSRTRRMTYSTSVPISPSLTSRTLSSWGLASTRTSWDWPNLQAPVLTVWNAETERLSRRTNELSPQATMEFLSDYRTVMKEAASAATITCTRALTSTSVCAYTQKSQLLWRQEGLVALVVRSTQPRSPASFAPRWSSRQVSSVLSSTRTTIQCYQRRC